MTQARTILNNTKRWVIKIGSALLTNEGSGLDRQAMSAWVEEMVALRESGREVVIVSSGAVAEGMKRLGWKKRPALLHELQAAAAVGQMGLVQAYESEFQKHGLHTAQILLTHDDLSHRTRYLNARSTLRTLLEMGIIPVINENDTVVTDEIRFGDNDTLAALVANLVEADLLAILTDQQGMYNRDPRIDSSAEMLYEADPHDASLDDMAGESKGALGRGGMTTKLRAARLAGRSGAMTIIASGRATQVLTRINAGERIGTLFLANKEPLLARKQWLAGHLQIKGQIVLDSGAVQVLKTKGTSLLSVGVVDVIGEFSRGDMVSCVNEEGREIARGLVNYSSHETFKIKGRASREIAAILGYADEPELIHRDNLVLL